MNSLIKALFLTIACFVTGKIGLLLVGPSAYSAVIWPPAGIGLVGILIFGYRFWPTIWLSSFLLFLVTFSDFHNYHSIVTLLIPAACIGLSATAQALIGVFLIRRFIKSPYSLEKEEDIVKFIFLSAPVSSIFGSYILMHILTFSKVIKSDQDIIVFIIAWIGSFLGILVFAPITMVFIGNPKEIWRLRRMTVALPVTLVFLVVFVLFMFIRSENEQRSLKVLSLTGELLADKIKIHLDAYYKELYALQSSYKTSTEVSKLEFNDRTKKLLNHKSIVAFSWNPRVNLVEKNIFEDAIQKEISPDFKIRFPLLNGVKVEKLQEKFFYYPVTYIEPYEKNKDVLGFDLSSNSIINSALVASLKSNDIALSDPISFGERLKVVVAVIPVHTDDPATNKKNSILKGFLLLYIDIDNLIYRDYKEITNEIGALRVFDANSLQGTVDLYQTTENKNLDNFIHAQNSIETANQTWTLYYYESKISLGSSKGHVVSFVLAVALLFLGFLEIFLLIITGRQTLIKRLVLEKTEDLNKSNDLLKNEVLERSRISEELERSNKELEQFAYVASHDLQEPLRMVASFTQLLEMKYKDQLDETAREYIHFAVDGAQRMQALIDDLLSFSRMGQKDVPKADVDLNIVCQQILRDVDILMKENKATVLIDPLPHVVANETQMRQLFLNLISNGIKYREERPPMIKVTCREVDVLVWQFAISDNGIGIDEKYFGKLFVIFKRLHTKQQYKGTGIGLALCKKIVENYGGRIWVESKVGEGTTFKFTLRSEKSL